MIVFLLGFSSGLVFSALIIVTLVYFKNPIQSRVDIIKQNIESIAPRPKGFIVEPDTEAQQIRERIIERNRRVGRDTHISELQ